MIGGKNKYLINGVNAQNSRVADLFRTVGLNVNNPHFLIMQGRVTKVSKFLNVFYTKLEFMKKKNYLHVFMVQEIVLLY